MCALPVRRCAGKLIELPLIHPIAQSKARLGGNTQAGFYVSGLNLFSGPKRQTVT